MNSYFLFDTRLMLLRARRRAFFRLLVFIALVVVGVALIVAGLAWAIDRQVAYNALVSVIFPAVRL